MLEALQPILKIQEFDMQMIQLMLLKRQRQAELASIDAMKDDLSKQAENKHKEILEMKKAIRFSEEEVNEIAAKFKKLETQQHSIKKVEEFNALNHEMSQTEREKSAKEQKLSDLYDRLAAEEEALKNLEAHLASTKDSNKVLEAEIHESITRINDEGRVLKEQRDELTGDVDPEALRIYERLLRNKKDRVLVPIENRCCSGCHIMLTAQDENMVRKGERIVFCEHCSRMHYWPDSEVLESATATTSKPRRRRASKV